MDWKQKNPIKINSFHLQWHITERCNLSCKHCYQDENFIKDELSLDKLRIILNKYVTFLKNFNLNDNRISITGGEPFIRKDIFDLIKIINSKNIKYGILTNGILLNLEKIKKLKNLNIKYLQVSLEGMQEKNDFIRGSGTFEKIIKILKLVKKSNINTNISFTLNKYNKSDVFDLINLAKKLNLPIGIKRLIPTGKTTNIKKLILEPKELKEIYKKIINNNPNLNGISFGCEDTIIIQEFNNYKPNRCLAGYSYSIMPNGIVYPCRRFPLKIGNILKESFEEIYNTKKLINIMDPNNINNACHYKCKYFDRCKGGSKCMSYAYFNDYTAPDPQCWNIFNKLVNPKIKWKNNYKNI